MRSSKQSIKYFPFAPGIPWKVKNGKYVVPELPSEAWRHALHGRDAVVVAYGGLIESFVSLSYLEILNYTMPSVKLHWCGNLKFKPLISINGLGSFEETNIKDIVSNYPVPLFMDQKDNVFFNCLNNYLNVKPYYGGKGYHDKKPIIRQIFRNSTFKWDTHYTPQLRNLNCDLELKRWAQSAKFQFKRPYVCVFPEAGWSQHDQSMLNWTDAELKAFSMMLKQADISVIVFTNYPNKYNNSIYTIPIRLDFMFNLIPNAKAVLSKDIDMLLISNMISSATLIGRPYKNELSLKKNNYFIERQNVIYTDKALTPYAAFNAIRGDV